MGHGGCMRKNSHLHKELPSHRDDLREQILDSLVRFVRDYPLLLLIVMTGISGLILQGYMTHPGLQTSGATFVLDLVLWFSRKHLRIFRGWASLLAIVALNLLAIIAVSLNNVDPFEQWVTSLYIILISWILLLRLVK